MGFIGMGWQEIGLIVVAAIILFGRADKLPEIASQAGKLLRDFRAMTTDMTGEFEKQTGVNVQDLKGSVDRELAGLKKEMGGATASIQKELNSAKATVSSTATSAKKSTSATSKANSATNKTATAKSAGKNTTAKKAGTSSSKTTAKQDTPPVATKNDPLADLGFFDSPEPAAEASSNGSKSSANSATASTSSNGKHTDASVVVAEAPPTAADAVSRARMRRAAAGYNHQSGPAAPPA